MWSIAHHAVAFGFKAESSSKKQQPKKAPAAIPPQIVPTSTPAATPPERRLSERAITEFSRAILHKSSELDSELNLDSPLTPVTPPHDASDESRSAPAILDSVPQIEMENNRLDYKLWQEIIPILEEHLPLESDTAIQKFISGIKIQLSKINVQDANSLLEGVISLKTYVAHHHDDHISSFDQLVYQHVPQEKLDSILRRINTVKEIIKTNQAGRQII